MLDFVHMDVFTDRPFSGNSLAVFPNAEGLRAADMLNLTQELRHFESVFLFQEGNSTVARVFDLFGELPFAGHPLLGAGACLHRQTPQMEATYSLTLTNGRQCKVVCRKENQSYICTLDQGRPLFLNVVSPSARSDIGEVFSLDPSRLHSLPIEVISTGLRYLVVPVRSALNEARIASDISLYLAELGADFAYLFDPDTFEGRHWNNDGRTEDVATGSAAGVIGAYCLKHGLVKPEIEFQLQQGQYVGRPSVIKVKVFGDRHDVQRVEVGGDVAVVGSGSVVRP